MIELERLALDDELLARLLAPADPGLRAASLDSLGLCTPEGVMALLEAAARLIIKDPARGRRLAALAAEVAEAAELPTARPRAHYLIARAHALNAEFEDALHLIEQTRAEFEDLGEPLEALRTNVGRIHVLREQGHYRAALAAGEAVLAGLAPPAFDHDPDGRAVVQALAEENIGSVYEELGRYEEALGAYAAAEAGYSALAMDDQLAAVRSNRGVVLLGLGRGREALAAFEQAEVNFAAADMTLPQATTLMNIGSAHLQLGAYSHALSSFERSRLIFARLDAMADLPALLLDTADAYLALNLYPEAVSSYRAADELLRAAGMPHDRARALWGLGMALAATGGLDEAERALAEAAGLFQTAGNLPLLSGVMLEQAGLLVHRRQERAALGLGQAALHLIEGHDFPIQQVYAHLRLADLRLPDLAAAERHLDAAAAAGAPLGLPHLHYRIKQRLGHLRRLQGHHGEALALVEAAIEAIEGLRGTLPFEAVRASFLQDKSAAYEELVQLHLLADDDDGPRRAFLAAERAKSRSLLELLAGAGERSHQDRDPALAARADELRADLNAIYLELLGGAPSVGPRPNPDDLRARAAELERELSVLRLRGAAAPTQQHAASATAHVPCAPAGTLLVAYHIVADEVLAFVCAGDRVQVVRELGRVDALQPLLQRLGDQWDRFRAGPAFVARHLAQLTQTTRRIMHELYRSLFAPLEPLLAALAADAPPGDPLRLAIVPHGPLHQIPFHALFDGERWLIDRFELSYAPSATVLAHCAAATPRSEGHALLVGVADPTLPAVEAELASIARLLPSPRVLRNADATRAAVAALAPGCTTVHLACHGLFRSDNPLYSALQLGDGWLTAAEVLALDLSGALVVLSACESGRGAILGGDEVVGLTRSFLGAGARTIVVSLWLVQDEAAADLMSIWYRAMAAGQGRAAALRRAQLATRERYPHPYYWAPFMLVGHP